MKIFFIAIVMISVLQYAGCYSVPKYYIPEDIKERTDQIIISKTGADFFKKYFSFNDEKSAKSENGYYITYQMEIPDKPYINETIEFRVDSSGNITDNAVNGIPDCLNGDCSYNITEHQAVEIAEKNGLEKGIKEWSPSFDWDEKYNKYVWNIRSIRSESPNTQGGKSSGTYIVIDTNTGEVLEKNDWHVR